MLPRLILLIFILLIRQLVAHTQDHPKVEPVKRITLLNPGFGYELPVSDVSTLQLWAGFSPSLVYHDGVVGGKEFQFHPGVSVVAAVRRYYNYRQRLNKDKRWEKNSMNYLGFRTALQYTERPLEVDASENQFRLLTSLSFVWGLQRNYSRNFSLDFFAGPGGAIGADDAAFSYDEKGNTRFTPTLTLSLTIGFWIK